VASGRDRRRLRRVALAGIPITALGATVAMMLVAGGDETAVEQGVMPPGGGQARKPPASAPHPGTEGSLADRDGGRGSHGPGGGGDGAGGRDPALIATLSVADFDAGSLGRGESARKRKQRPERSRRRSGDRHEPAPVGGGAATADQPPALLEGPGDTDLAKTPAKRVAKAPGNQRATGDGPQKTSGGRKPGKGPELLGDDKPGRGPHDGGPPSLPQGPPSVDGILPPGQLDRRRRAG
jgi:hypothetical protein